MKIVPLLIKSDNVLAYRSQNKLREVCLEFRPQISSLLTSASNGVIVLYCQYRSVWLYDTHKTHAAKWLRVP